MKKFNMSDDFFSNTNDVKNIATKKGKKSLSLNLSEDLKIVLKEKASSVGRTLTSYINNMLDNYIDLPYNDIAIPNGKKVRICLNIDLDLYERVKSNAQKSNRDMASFIIQILLNHSKI